MPGYNFCFRNQDKRRGGGVGLNIKDTITYKERQELSKLDETIEYGQNIRGRIKIKTT